MKSPTTFKQAFTLLELLIVLGLMGLIFAIALPSLSALSSTSDLDAAANALHTAIKTARQYALTHRQPTYLVLQDDFSTDNPDLAYRSFALFTINTHTRNQNGQVESENGQFINNWQSLPPTIVFDVSDDFSGNALLPDDQATYWSGGFGPNNLLAIEATNYPVIGFSAKGLPSQNARHDLYLCEGFYPSKQAPLQRTSSQGRQLVISKQGHSRIQKIQYTPYGSLETAP